MANANMTGLTTDTSAKSTSYMMDPNALVVIGVDTQDGPEHPLYDERIKLPIDEDMVTNIMRRGVIQTVLVKKDGDRLVVVDGRRRVLHARLAAARQAVAGQVSVRVPTALKRGDEKDLFGLSRAANAYRVQDSPIINAKSAQRMMDMGATIEEIANDLNVKPATVTDWLKILDTPDAIQDQLHTGEVPLNAGIELAKLSSTEAIETLESVKSNLAPGQKVTAENVTAAVRARQGKSAPQTPKTRLERCHTLLTQLAKLCPDGDISEVETAALAETLNKLSLAVNSQKWSTFCKDTNEE